MEIILYMLLWLLILVICLIWIILYIEYKEEKEYTIFKNELEKVKQRNKRVKKKE